MPIVITDARDKQKHLADAVYGNSIRCGHCDQPIKDGVPWLALDDPYWCLIHETCRNLFKYNKLNRSIDGAGRLEAKRDLDDMQKKLHGMLQRPYWQKSKAFQVYAKALQDLLLLHQSLRSSRVILDSDNPGVPAEAKNDSNLPQFKLTREQLDKSIQESQTELE